MKLYDGGKAPNPRRVRVFLKEKGIEVPLVPVDLGTMAHKSAEFTAINPLQRVPALVLDDGTIITESIAICRYFEALQKGDWEVWRKAKLDDIEDSGQHELLNWFCLAGAMSVGIDAGTGEGELARPGARQRDQGTRCRCRKVGTRNQQGRG